MNHQTKELLNNAISEITDQGVFSDDQIILLTEAIMLIGKAIAKECQCSKGSCL